MTSPDCHKAQQHIASGALLKAGTQLSPGEMQALQAHLRQCAACQALVAQMEGLESLLRASLHSRWDAVPRPKQISPKAIQNKMRKQTMLLNFKTLAGTALVLLVIVGAFFVFRQMAPAGMTQEIINPNPEEVMLRSEDMPVDTEYYMPGENDKHPLQFAKPRILQIDNASLAQSMGKEQATKFINDTGRKDGWSIYFQRIDPNDIDIEAVRNWMTLHETPQGAQAIVKDYYDPAGKEFPRNSSWESLGPVNDLGDVAFAAKLSNWRTSDWEETTYMLNFAYRNISARVQVVDRSDRVTLQDAIYYAQIVLKRLQASN